MVFVVDVDGQSMIVIHSFAKSYPGHAIPNYPRSNTTPQTRQPKRSSTQSSGKTSTKEFPNWRVAAIRRPPQHITSLIGRLLPTWQRSADRMKRVVAVFLYSFVVSTGILLLFTIPTFYLAWRKGRKKTARRFLVAAILVGFLAAVIAVSSGQLLDRCEAANNRACFDYGSAGMRLTFMVGFIIVSWVRAFSLLDE